MKQCSFLGLVKKTIGCAQTMRNWSERVSHQLIKVERLIDMLPFDKQFESEAALLTMLYYLNK